MIRIREASPVISEVLNRLTDQEFILRLRLGKCLRELTLRISVRKRDLRILKHLHKLRLLPVQIIDIKRTHIGIAALDPEPVFPVRARDQGRLEIDHKDTVLCQLLVIHRQRPGLVEIRRRILRVEIDRTAHRNAVHGSIVPKVRQNRTVLLELHRERPLGRAVLRIEELRRLAEQHHHVKTAAGIRTDLVGIKIHHDALRLHDPVKPLRIREAALHVLLDRRVEHLLVIGLFQLFDHQLPELVQILHNVGKFQSLTGLRVQSDAHRAADRMDAADPDAPVDPVTHDLLVRAVHMPVVLDVPQILELFPVLLLLAVGLLRCLKVPHRVFLVHVVVRLEARRKPLRELRKFLLGLLRQDHRLADILTQQLLVIVGNDGIVVRLDGELRLLVVIFCGQCCRARVPGFRSGFLSGRSCSLAACGSCALAACSSCALSACSSAALSACSSCALSACALSTGCTSCARRALRPCRALRLRSTLCRRCALRGRCCLCQVSSVQQSVQRRRIPGIRRRLSRRLGCRLGCRLLRAALGSAVRRAAARGNPQRRRKHHRRKNTKIPVSHSFRILP